MDDKQKQIEELTNIIMTIQTIYHEKASSEQIAQGLVNANYQKVNGNTSDGYHTFNELYHHRAVLFSVICNNYKDLAWKSKKHHDGTMYDGMFIVGIDTPQGQATYHYDIEPYWDMFKVKELYAAPLWDGHTPQQAIERIGNFAPKIPEGSVVISKEEYERLKLVQEINLDLKRLNETLSLSPTDIERIEQQAVKEVLEKVKEKCKKLEDKFSHLCKSKKECLMETCRYEGVLAVKRELNEIAKEFGVEV